MPSRSQPSPSLRLAALISALFGPFLNGMKGALTSYRKRSSLERFPLSQCSSRTDFSDTYRPEPLSPDHEPAA